MGKGGQILEMITLHESNITSFPFDNGIGVLSDAIKAYAEEEINSIFEFYMEYDSEGHLVDELKEERIIKAKAQDKLGYQLFRIYSITKNHENDNLIVNAQHITYDLANNFVEELLANRLTKKQVMEKISASTVIPHTFNVTSSNATTVSSTSLYRTNPLQMIAGMEGSVLQIWGGQIERDNFHLILHDRRGHEDGVTVTYEKNITGLEATFDISGVITRIFPFVFIEATDDSPERLITVSGKYIDSPHINDYEVIRTEPIDYSSDDRIDTQDTTDAQIRQQLTNVAKDYFKETGNDKIKSTMDVAFMHLWETEEYKDVKVLELVGMGDTVTINHNKLKVDATSIVNYIKYDCIAHINEEVKLGSVKAGLTDSINRIDAIERKADKAESNANQAIVSANGKNTTYYGPDEPFQGMQKGDLWFKVIDGQYHKTYRFDGIEWKEILDMDSQEAKAEAQQAKDRAEEAYGNANIATQNAIEAIDIAQEGFDKSLEAIDGLTTLYEFKDETTDLIASIKGDVQGLQTTVSKKVDESTFSTFVQQTNNSIAGKISMADAEGVFVKGTTFSATIDGLQTTVSNKADKSTVTQLASIVDTKISTTDANNRFATQSQLTQTSNSLTSTITSVKNDLEGLEISETNLVLDSNKKVNGTAYRLTGYDLTLDWIAGEKWTVVIKGEINEGQRFGIWANGSSTQQVYVTNLGNGYHRATFTVIKTTVGGTNAGEKIMNVYNYPSATAQSASIEWIKLVRAEKTSLSWQPAPEDMATQSELGEWGLFTISQISQLDSAINLRVKKGDVINQINIDTSGILISGKKLILDGDTTVLGTFKVDGSAHIKDASIGTAQIGTIDAAIANIINLSANSIVGGILTSQNSTTAFNLNTGNLDFNSNASIRFNSSSGGVRRIQNGRSAILSFPISAGSTTPMTAMGVVAQTGSINVNDSTFRGIRIHGDNVSHTNDLINDTWTFSRRVDQTLGSIQINLGTGTKGIFPQYTGSYDYNLGSPNNKFDSLHVNSIKGSRIYISNPVGLGGWSFDTQPESGGVSMTFRGINAGVTDYLYNLGTTVNPFNFARINHLRPQSNNVSSSVGASNNRYNYVYTNSLVEGSDISIKDNIQDSNLGLDFINDLRIVNFRMKDSGLYKLGVIAQELENTLIDHGVDIRKQGMVFTNDDVMGVAYTQLIPPLANSVQEIDGKIDLTREELVLKIAKLEDRLSSAEQKISELESAA